MAAQTASVSTVTRGLAEPADVLVEHGEDGAPQDIVVVETNAHRLVRIGIEVARAIAEEGVVHETQAVGHAQHARQPRGNGHEQLHRTLRFHLQRFGEEHLLGDEAVQQRHARHRGGCDDRQRRGEGHHARKAPQLAQVARAGRWVRLVDLMAGAMKGNLYLQALGIVENAQEKAQVK